MATYFWNKPLPPAGRWAVLVAFAAIGISIDGQAVLRGTEVPMKVIFWIALVYGAVRLAGALLWALATRPSAQAAQTAVESQGRRDDAPRPVVAGKFACRKCGELVALGQLDEDRICDPCRPPFVGAYR